MSRAKTDSPPRPAREAEQVFESVHHIMHLFRCRQYGALKGSPHALTHLEGKLLGFFSRHPGASLRYLVEHSGRDKSQLARLIAGLKKQGLLEGRADPVDRRAVRLRLTPEGRAIHRTLRRQLGKFSEVAIQDFSPAERRQLLRLLDRVQANLEPARDTPACGKKIGRKPRP